MLSKFLTENRIEFLKKQHAAGIDTSHDEYAIHRKSNDIVDHFATHADPSANKQYTQWIVGQYAKQGIRQEDAPRIHGALSDFNKYKGKLPEKDINKYHSLNDIEAATQPHKGTAATKAEEVHQGLEVLYKDPKYQINHLKSKEASMAIYGGGARSGKALGTNWCTAADGHSNYFDRYTLDGKQLHTIHVKDDEKSPYQFHTSGQFMDRHDCSVVPSEFPAKHTPIVDHLGMLHPMFDTTGKHIDKFLNHENFDVRYVAMQHPNATAEHISKGLQDTSYSVRIAAMRHPNATAEHVSKGLQDEKYGVRIAAVEHPNATTEHISTGLQDPHPYVRSMAQRVQLERG